MLTLDSSPFIWSQETLWLGLTLILLMFAGILIESDSGRWRTQSVIWKYLLDKCWTRVRSPFTAYFIPRKSLLVVYRDMLRTYKEPFDLGSQ